MVMLKSTLRKPDGQIFITQPGMPTIERDTFQCRHCQKICIVRKGSHTQRGYCFMCYGPTCGRKMCSEGCTPWEAKMEAREGRRQFHKAMGGY